MIAIRRFRQGIRSLFVFTRHIDHSLAEQYLNAKQLALFQQLSRSEQLHCLNVLGEVLAQPDTASHGLAQSALLHDIGKIRYRQWTWQKTFRVIVASFFPRFAHQLKFHSLNPLTAPFIVGHYHPIWGAEILKSLEVSDKVIWLTKRHHDSLDQWVSHSYFTDLQRLQEADNKY